MSAGGEKCDVPKEDEDELDVLVKKSNKLRSELHSLMSSQKVVDITRTKVRGTRTNFSRLRHSVVDIMLQGGGRVSNQRDESTRKLREAAARREAEQLQMEVMQLLTGGGILLTMCIVAGVEVFDGKEADQ